MDGGNGERFDGGREEDIIYRFGVGHARNNSRPKKKEKTPTRTRWPSAASPARAPAAAHLCPRHPARAAPRHPPQHVLLLHPRRAVGRHKEEARVRVPAVGLGFLSHIMPGPPEKINTNQHNGLLHVGEMNLLSLSLPRLFPRLFFLPHAAKIASTPSFFC